MRTFVAMMFLLCAAGASAQSSQPLPLDSAHWKRTGDARIENYMGRPALTAHNGGAIAEGASLQDGTVELELAVGTHRNFAIIAVRRTGEGEYEEFYFRTHKSELPDAVQYCPAWKGVGGWQLFHGPGYTARATFVRDQWIPVRIVLSGDRAAVFEGQTAQPQLVVDHLVRDTRAGGIQLEAVIVDDAHPEARTAFSNVVLRPGVVDFDFSKVPPRKVEPAVGLIQRWELSDSFVPARGAIQALPPAKGWQTVPILPNGLVVFERYLKRSEDERAAALARVVVDAPADEVRPFRFGYSDEVTVFLNGKPLFSGDAHYSHDNPRQEGLIGLFQGMVYLPLKKGRNELVLAIAEVFGGWGVMGEFPEPEGLRITP